MSAAEILLKRGASPEGVDMLNEALSMDPGPMLLQTAISIRHIGAQAEPLVRKIETEVYPKIAGDIWGKYKSWMYPMFIGMALDQTLDNCAEASPETKYTD